MDHDAHSPKMQTLVDVVHSVFNAATGVSEADEANEVRNFESLKFFTDLLEAHGFERMTDEPLMRQGDSTLNSIVRFRKKLTSVDEITSYISKEKDASRPQQQTYMTAPEWRNVHAVEAYSSHAYAWGYML